jgi:hypothetical protein
MNERKFNVTKNTQGFSVGDRVKVVAPGVHHKGKCGEVRSIEAGRYMVCFSGDQRMWFDRGDEYQIYYYENEIAPSPATPAPITTKVIEGEVREIGGEIYVGNTNFSTLYWQDEMGDCGDHVRITIEVLRKAGESK